MSSPTLETLQNGDVTVIEQIAWSSNATFLAVVDKDGERMPAVYKPLAGERPLHDFPPGLYKRERAAYLASNALGWDLVPETIIRDDVEHGVGSLQRVITIDGQHYFTLRDDESYAPVFQRIAMFDVLINNADRKSGHVIQETDGAVYAIDHGVTFHTEPKLRTVLWDFVDQPYPAADLETITSKIGDVIDAVADLLFDIELVALRERATHMVDDPVFPAPTNERSFPWPLV